MLKGPRVRTRWERNPNLCCVFVVSDGNSVQEDLASTEKHGQNACTRSSLFHTLEESSRDRGYVSLVRWHNRRAFVFLSPSKLFSSSFRSYEFKHSSE